MQVTIVAVGKMRRGALAALCQDYARRLPWTVTIREVEERRPIEGAARLAREGALLLAALPGDVFPVALDEGGKRLDSAGFALELARWRDQSGGRLAFVIGGAGGLAPAVRARCRAALSLGAMTWPHLLARALLLEQLYRAHAILSGHPYHRA